MNDWDGDKSLVCADTTIIKVAERNMKNVVPLYYKMATESPPTFFFNGINFNPTYYENEVNNNITQSAGDARYIEKDGDTATGLINFSAGASTTTLTASSLSSLTGGLIINVANDYKPVESPANIQQKMTEEDPIEKDLEVVNQEEQKLTGSVSDRLRKFLSAFEWQEIASILEKKGINKKIESEADLEDPQILDVLEDYYKGMNLEKLNPVFDPIAQEITSLLMHNKTNEQRLVKLINQYWGLGNRSTRFDSTFMRELNLKLKQVAQTERLQLRKFLLILRMNFQTKPKLNQKPSIFPQNKK
jgi:hypothetical protein